MRSCLLLAALLSAAAATPAAAEVSTPGAACQECVAGPWRITHTGSRTRVEKISFPSFAGQGYELVVRDWSSRGRGATVSLNGRRVLRLAGGGGAQTALPAPTAVPLRDNNTMTARMRGPASLTLEVRATGAASLPSCGTADNRQLFGLPLTPASRLGAVEPLGGLSPPSHTLPTHHVVFQPIAGHQATEPLKVRAPARMRLVAVEWDRGDDDYSLHLRPCAEVRLYLHHIKQLDGRLAELLGDRRSWVPISESPERREGFGAVALTTIDLPAGALLGTTGVGNDAAYNVGLIDRRQMPLGFVNPARYAVPPSIFDLEPLVANRLVEELAPERLQQYCPLDYFHPSIANAYRNLAGSGDGSRRRRAEPRCGEHMQDVEGTAQGNWFWPKSPSSALFEEELFAFVHDDIDPSVPILSFGERGPRIPDSPGSVIHTVTYRVSPDPVVPDVARVNRDPRQVAPGVVHCFDGLLSGARPIPGALLLYLPRRQEVRLLYVPGPERCHQVLPRYPPDQLRQGRDGVVTYVR